MYQTTALSIICSQVSAIIQIQGEFNKLTTAILIKHLAAKIQLGNNS